MKEKKKGFTLIELLAVIVILAIIALIATPIILNLIEISRKGAFTRSAEGVLKSAKLYYAQSLLTIEESKDIEFSCNNRECISSEVDEKEKNITLDVDGNMGTGTVNITQDGKISFELYSGVYCAEKTVDEEKITVSKRKCGEVVVNPPKDLSISSKTENIGELKLTGVVSNKIAEIESCEFSIDGGNTWKKATLKGNTYEYTFTGLEINKPYTVKMKVTNTKGESETKEIEVTIPQISMSEEDIEIKPSGWATSKTVTINYPDIDTNIYKKVYKLTDSEYIEYTGPIELEANDNIEVDIQKKEDNTSILNSTVTINVTKVDTSEPTSSSFGVTNKTSNSITVKAEGIDENSGITHYQFSKDNGATWEPSEPQENSIYTFTGLTQYTDYNIKVKVYNGTYVNGGILYKESDVQTVKTEAAKYTITFNANGGTVSTTEKEVTYNSAYGVLPIPTYSGAEFIGWYTDKEAGDKIEETTIVTITNNQTLYAHWKQKDTLVNKTYTTGDAVTLGGYNWHVVGDTGTQVTLLMDANQLEDNSVMAHCSSVKDSSNNCFNGSYIVYSWKKSLIKKYLNGAFLTKLESKITNTLVSTEICADPSIQGYVPTTYGGYLMSELEALDKKSACSSTVSDKVRLITYSEYYNMSPYYTTEDDNYPNVENIKRIKIDSDYTNWFSCQSNKCGDEDTGSWWTMHATNGSNISWSYMAIHNGSNIVQPSYADAVVRPVITVVK